MLLDVELNKISFIGSGNDREILHNVRFSIPRSSVYSIIGNNGTGKTTLAKAIGGLLDPGFYKTDGKIILNGENILEMTQSEVLYIRRNSIRYVFQDPVNSFDPLRKLKYYFDLLDTGIEQIERYLDYFRLPGYNTLSNLHPFEASGGMMQRVSFIIALLSRPSLLIMDEPTSAIDAPVVNLFMLKLQEYISENDSAALMITQDIPLARKISQQTGLLENGTLSEYKDEYYIKC